MVELYLLKDTRQTSEHMGDYYPRVDYKETYDVPMLAHSNERRLVDYVFVRHDSAIQASLMALAALSVASSLPSVGTYGEEHLDWVIIHELNAVEGDDGVGIGDMKEMALTAGKRTAVHGLIS